MRFPETFVEEVLDRTDIEELIGRYVTLKRTGSNLVGLCPFHSEKTPSFSVTPAKRMFYCFGCHAGGSAITFVQRAENLDFPDAVEFLANRAGLPLPMEKEDPTEANRVSRKRVLDANLEAARFFRACLNDPRIGAPGMAYLKGNRKLSDATIKHFGLGFAPDSFGMLTDHLHKKGFSDEELFAAYLCAKSQKTGRAYDIFRNRVMFPIIDPGGNIVAFGGRVMDDSKPKYLNSGDTPAFKKSNQLFALNYAKNDCAERMILCEGYMDVIALHAAGFPFAVATLGTAITPNHARIFSKYTKKVIISYDSDEAGQNAANKAMRILGEVGMDVRVLRMSGAKDPDEYIRNFGADRFRRLLDESRTGFDFRMEAILAKYNLDEGSEKLKASNDLCAVIADYYTPIEREIYIAKVAGTLNLPPDALRDTVERDLRRRKREQREKQSREAEATLKNFGDRVNPDAARNPRAAAAEETVLGLLLNFSEYRQAVENGSVTLTPAHFLTAFGRRVFEETMKLEKEAPGFPIYRLESLFTPEEVGRIYQMTTERSLLERNGIEVFRSAVNALISIGDEETAKQGNLSDTLNFLRNKIKKNEQK